MGQYLSCLNCEKRRTKVVPLGTLPNGMKQSNSTLGTRNVSFHRPVSFSLGRASVERISNCSSLATISLGSMQTLSSAKGETVDNEIRTEDNQENSPSSKRHPGMF